MLGYWFLLQLLGGSAGAGRGWRGVLGARGRVPRRRGADLDLQGSRAGAAAPGAGPLRLSAGDRPSCAWRRPRSAAYVLHHVRPPATRRVAPSAAAPFDVPVAPRNPGMPLELDWVEEVRVNRSAVERRAATLADPADGQEGVAGGLAAPRRHPDGPHDPLGRRHAGPGAPALRQGAPAGAGRPAGGDGRRAAAHPGRRGLRVPHLRRDRGGGARGLGDSGGGGLDRFPGRALAASRSASGRSARRWPRARRRSTS